MNLSITSPIDRARARTCKRMCVRAKQALLLSASLAMFYNIYIVLLPKGIVLLGAALKCAPHIHLIEIFD